MDGVPHSSIPPSIGLEHNACPLCGPAARDVPVLIGHDLLHKLPGVFAVVACANCGLKRTSPRPTPQSIGFYYPDDYGPYLGTIVSAQQGATPRGLKARAIALGKWMFDTKAHAIPPVPPGRMLEIGCASGSYLHEMAQRGWDVEGIEFSPDAAATARKLGYRVDTGALETIYNDASQFDLIVGWMVLEHLHEPVAALAKLHSWIRPGGRLVISVPDSGGYEFNLFGPRWYSLHLPNHLFHYDRATIRQTLAAAGWRVSRIQHHRTLADAVASSGYWLRDKGFARIGQTLITFPERGGRLGALALFPFAWVAALAGQTGRMTVWAEPT